MTLLFRRVVVLFSFLLLVPFAFALAADSAVFLADKDSDGKVRLPRAGEWLSYVVAYRVDPLEHSLRPDAARDTVEKMDIASAPLDVPPIWRTTQLRIVVRQVEEKGCKATLTHQGVSREVFLPFDAPVPEYEYDGQPPPAVQGRHMLGGAELPVDITTRSGPNGGYVRYYSPEVPFGVVRFASEDVDVILVAFGAGQPSELLPAPSGIVPPPGELYKP